MPKLKDFVSAENELDGQEYVYISQSDKTRKTTLQKMKDFILGAGTLKTTSKTIIGAINETNESIGDRTTLKTTDKANLVNAINENTASLSQIANNSRAQYSMISGATTINNSWLPIAWSKKIYDTDEFVNQTGNTTIKIKESGLYIITVAICFSVSSTVGSRNIKIVKNTNEVIAYDSRNAWNKNNTRCNLSTIQYFNANETFVVSVYQDSGANIDLVVETGFPLLSIAKIGGAS